MKLAALALSAAVITQHFEGDAARNELCSFLLNARETAEIEGRLDFDATVQSAGDEASPGFVARISMGPAYAVSQIHFSGHRSINDSTLRRMFYTVERDMLNVDQLRRGLTRINKLGMFEPLAVEDVIMTRLEDGVSVDLTIPLRERKPRWWSVSGMLLPGMNGLRASIGARLPGWGRGGFEMATYFVSFNIVGFGAPLVALERSLIPGYEWLSGFAITSSLSPRSIATDYARAHALPLVAGILESSHDDPMAVHIESAAAAEVESLVCKASRPRWWWLRGAARQLLAFYS